MAPSTREKLLLTAARLFHEQGYAATGIATILRESDTNAGSLYHFFPSKDDLLRGVLDWYEEMLWPVVLGPVEEVEPDPIERIFRLLDWYREGIAAADCRKGCPIGNLALEISDTHPELRPRIDANFRGWAEGIQKWLEEARERLPPDTDIVALSRFVLTVMEGGLMQVRAADDLRPFDDSVRVLRDHFDRILSPASPTPQKGPTR